MDKTRSEEIYADIEPLVDELLYQVDSLADDDSVAAIGALELAANRIEEMIHANQQILDILEH